MSYLRPLLAAALGVCAALPAQAQFAGAGDLGEVVEVRLLEGWRMADGTHMAALSIQLAPGWKTYWRAPGEGGIPPELDLRGSTNVTGHAIRWPAPEVFLSNGMRSIGYRGDVILPLQILPQDGGPIRIAGEIDMGVCEDICMPVRLAFDGVLSPGAEADRRIEAALATLPLTEAEAGAGPVRCALEPIADGMRLTATIPVRDQGADEHVVVELPGTEVWIDEAQSARQGGTITAMTDLVPPFSGPFALDRSDLVFTVLGSRGAVELSGCTG